MLIITDCCLLTWLTWDILQFISTCHLLHLLFTYIDIYLSCLAICFAVVRYMSKAIGPGKIRVGSVCDTMSSLVYFTQRTVPRLRDYRVLQSIVISIWSCQCNIERYVCTSWNILARYYRWICCFLNILCYWSFRVPKWNEYKVKLTYTN